MPKPRIEANYSSQQAWLPIMGRYNGRILFVDGFAGPGRYAGGEEGSPLIAQRTLLGHPQFQAAQGQREVAFVFIEKEQDRAGALREELRQFEAKSAIPAWLDRRSQPQRLSPVGTRSRRAPLRVGGFEQDPVSASPGLTVVPKTPRLPSLSETVSLKGHGHDR